MQRSSPRPIGILAGGRSLPIEIAKGLSKRGAAVHIVAIEGEADDALDAFHPTKVNWGQIGRIMASFKKAGCRQIAIAGSVRRPDLSTINPDLGFFRALPTVLRLIRAGGDDAILRGVIAYFEKQGFEIVGVSQLAPELLVGAGPFAGPVHMPEDLNDIRVGFEALRALAPFDVGQALVVDQGRIEAIEGAEGTDRMLDRLTLARHRRMRERKPVGRGVLVKATKPGQEIRVDMPAIGPETVRKAAGADLKGIAVEAGRVLAVNRSTLQDLAETHRVFVIGASAEDVSRESYPTAALPAAVAVRRLGRRRLRTIDEADSIKAAQLIIALERFEAARAAVVSRNHVLAVESGEGALETIERAANLRQWGRSMLGRRYGVAVVAAGRELDSEVIGKAAEAGLAGVAVVLRKFAASVAKEAITEADRRKLFIAALAG